MESGSIRPIGHNSVHKICSGQVVLTLATAVKELVENSLDVGATNIEVKLKEYGSELIEVIDNGKGVKESDFQGITLKHHTSKINDFSDVQYVNTFGFRGEALSSLCALSDVEIVTCHSDSAVGSLLTYDHDGTLVKCCPTHRQVGMTVILKNLFYTLPVRHKEFHRNIRREYAKMIQLLTAYCLISINRRITCTHTTGKGKKTVVLSTNSSSAVKDNIVCIFGSKQADDLMEFVQHLPSEADLEEYALKPSALERCGMLCVSGFVSSCNHGDGRSSADRQFFFIDGRPCDLPKVSKLVNEVYHQFNKAQYPFVLFNVVLQSGSADVNVTPDKRQIFIPEEKLLLCIVKASLYQMYRPTQMRVAPSPFFRSAGTPLCKEVQKESTSPPPEVSEEERDTAKRKADERNGLFSPPAKSSRLEESNEEVPKEKTGDLPDNLDSGIGSQETVAAEGASQVALTIPFDDERGCVPNLKEVLRKACRAKGAPTRPTDRPRGNRSGGQKATPASDKIVHFLCRTSKERSHENPIQRVKAEKVADTPGTSRSSPEDALVAEMDPAVDEARPRKRRTKTVAISMDVLRRRSQRSRDTGEAEGGVAYRRFRSRISPAENQSAEEELNKEIRKEDFSEMQVVGQFNLGFIVARLRDDLFIIDQHATDEKYHYETLRRDAALDTQPLVNPQILNLTAASEAVLLDHLPIFEKSGFRFHVDEGGPVGKKVQLTSVPIGHTWTFGKEDVDEMIFMLTDNPVTTIRPSRVNQLFASRACRKSVMIGTALTPQAMKKLILHMGEIEQPWNCPHGRPTIRHLFNLNLLKSTAEGSAEELAS